MRNDTPTLVFFCNALDDSTRIERGINTDSPAASHKVLGLARAARLSGMRSVVLSLGRGKPHGKPHYYRGKVVRSRGVPIIYAPFATRRLLSELVSLVAPLRTLYRLRRFAGQGVVLFYNRTAAYLPALIVARMLGFRMALDLEDGETPIQRRKVFPGQSAFRRWMFDSWCNAGALVAAESLLGLTSLRPAQACYGVAESYAGAPRWSDSEIVVLFGGTVASDTGAGLLRRAIEILRERSAPAGERLRIVVTGKGDAIPSLQELARDQRPPRVEIQGRTTDDAYARLLRQTHVGLALKPNAGPLARTTFPSKVVELASRGILVITTDISDVRRVLSKGALYLTEDDPASLAAMFEWVVEHRTAAAEVAANGKRAVVTSCAPGVVGEMLRRQFFPRGEQHTRR